MKDSFVQEKLYLFVSFLNSEHKIIQFVWAKLLPTFGDICSIEKSNPDSACPSEHCEENVFFFWNWQFYSSRSDSKWKVFQTLAKFLCSVVKSAIFIFRGRLWGKTFLFGIIIHFYHLRKLSHRQSDFSQNNFGRVTKLLPMRHEENYQGKSLYEKLILGVQSLILNEKI